MFVAKTIAIAGLMAIAAEASKDGILPLPPNGYLGNLNTEITCQALGINVTFAGTFAATGPLVVQSGQEFYANDVALNITVPAVAGGGANLIGAKSFSALVTLTIENENLTPTTYSPFPNGRFFNASLNPNGDTIVSVPALPGVLSGFGPFVGGKAGEPGITYLGTVTLQIYLNDASGKSIIGPVTAVCSPPQYRAILATFNIVEPYESNPAPINITDGPTLINYPPVAPNVQYGCSDFTYDCHIGKVGPLPVEVGVCGALGGFYDYNSQFSLNNLSSRITIPANIAQAIPALYPNATNFDFTAETLIVELTNVSPSSMNSVPAGGLKQHLTIPPSGDIVFYLPETTTLNVGPFTVITQPSNGNYVRIDISNTTAHSTFYDDSGNNVGEADLVCVTHVQPLTFIGIPITPQGSQLVNGLTGL